MKSSHYAKSVFLFVNVDWFFASHRLNIARSAKKNSVDMQVFADITQQCPPFSIDGFVFSPSPLKRKSGFASSLIEFWMAVLLIRKDPPNVLHAVTIKPIILVGVIARLFRLPFVGSISGLGPAFNGNSARAKARRAAVLYIYRFVFSRPNARAICQTDHDRSFLIRHGVCAEENIALIRGSGVDLSVMQAIQRRRASSQVATVLMASRLLRDKGIFEFLAMARELNQTTNDTEFLLAGPEDIDSPTGICLSEIVRECEACGVTYVGNIEDIAGYLVNVDLFVYPSYYPEGLPKILLEVAASGIPIVTTDHPGCRDAIIVGETGVTVPVKDVGELVKATSSLLADRQKMRRMGVRARKLAEAEFGDSGVVYRHFQIYDELSL